ncbi:hypothetical protein D3C85_1491030 [compost metagenome]
MAVSTRISDSQNSSVADSIRITDDCPCSSCQPSASAWVSNCADSGYTSRYSRYLPNDHSCACAVWK